MIALHFGFGALEAEFWRWMFMMTRIGAAMFAAPLFGATYVPPQVRVIATGALALLVCGWTGVAAPPQLVSLPGLLAIAGEIVLGLALGYVLQWSFGAPVLAAEVIGGGMGLAIATTSDPVSGAQSPALGQYFSVMLTVLFLAAGAHLQWFALLVDSYRTFPPGTVWLSPDRLQVIILFGSRMFATAAMIALPVTLMLLMVQVITGIVGRSAPSLNLMALGLPAGVLAGIGALLLSAPLVTDRLAELAGSAVSQAGALLAK